MDRDRLKRYLDEGLSLAEIGILENRDPSTVGYWVKKHGLEANGRELHAARGELSRELLEDLVARDMTLAEIAQELDRSVSSVRHWLRKYGIATRGRRGPRPMISRERIEEAVKAGRRTLEGTCRTHGAAIFVIEPSGKARCRLCRMERVSARRRTVKRTLVEEAGGRCVRCGYDRFVGALQFHHRDAKGKRFGLAQKGATISIDRLRAEARKCDLLCANCHAEVEHGGVDP